MINKLFRVRSRGFAADLSCQRLLKIFTTNAVEARLPDNGNGFPFSIFHFSFSVFRFPFCLHPKSEIENPSFIYGQR